MKVNVEAKKREISQLTRLTLLAGRQAVHLRPFLSLSVDYACFDDTERQLS